MSSRRKELIASDRVALAILASWCWTLAFIDASLAFRSHPHCKRKDRDPPKRLQRAPELPLWEGKARAEENLGARVRSLELEAVSVFDSSPHTAPACLHSPSLHAAPISRTVFPRQSITIPLGAGHQR